MQELKLLQYWHQRLFSKAVILSVGVGLAENPLKIFVCRWSVVVKGFQSSSQLFAVEHG
jgi:hypothetical protein